MSKRFIDDYKVLLLDMGNTFMFGSDRFGPEIDYYPIYRELGGQMMSDKRVSLILNRLFDHMLAVYRDPGRYHDYGAVAEFLEQLSEAKDLPRPERVILEQVFARQEMGRIPDTHVRILGELRKTHPLGLVSNIWSGRDLFEKEFKRIGIYDLFDILVWSSNHGCIKPSAHLFETALARFPADASQVLFIGDNLMRDVGGARALGMATVWITNGQSKPLHPDPKPDLIVQDLGNLLSKASNDIGNPVGIRYP